MLKKKLFWMSMVLGLLYSLVNIYSQTNVTATFRGNLVVTDSLTVAGPDSVSYRLDGYSERYNSINNVRIQYWGKNVDTVAELWIEGSQDGINWAMIDTMAVQSSNRAFYEILRASSWKYFRLRKYTEISDTTDILFLMKGGN